MRRRRAGMLALLLLVASCGSDRPSTDAPSTEPTEPPDTTGSTEPPDRQLPGEKVETHPSEGDQLAVAGVAADDTLNVRTGPGVVYPVLLELAPLATNVTATGHNRSLGEGGLWSEVIVDGETGWAGRSFLYHLGQVRDITFTLFPNLTDRPRAATILELGEMIAALRASTDVESDLVVVDGPELRVLAEVTIDVIGLADDAQGGERVRILAEPDPDGGYIVLAVETTALCSRGATADGRCV